MRPEPSADWQGRNGWTELLRPPESTESTRYG